MLKVKPFLFILFLTVFVALFTTACSDTGSNSSGGIYDNSTTNPGGGTENPGGGDIENPGGGDTENPGGGEEDKPGVTAVNEFPANPLALLGIYNVTSQSVDGTSQEVAAGSEFRVNVDTKRLLQQYVDVLVRIKVNGKTIDFQREVSLAGNTIGSDFFEKIFTEMGAKVTGKYTLEFTLASEVYNELVAEGIIIDGQTLVISLDKTKDLAMDSGLDETPTDPEEPEEPGTVPVESVTIKGQQPVVHGGAPFKLTAEVLPNDATNKVVTWSSSHPDYIAVDTQGNVTIKGYTEETITITATSTADNTKTASWKVNIEKATVTGISVTPAEMTLTLKNDGSEVSANITTAIEPAIATDYTTVNYAVTSGAEYIKVDANGVVTAVAQGEAVVTVTVGSLTKTVNVTVNPAPLEEIPVTNITVTTSADKVYKKGTNVTINFTLTPTTTTDTMVKYTTQSSSGNLPTSNGTGSFEFTNVQGGETVTFTTDKGQQAKYTINAVEGINAISFENNEVTKDQNTVFTNNIVNYDAISNSIASWTYSSDDESIASVDPVTGQVTAKKNGVTTIRVTAQPKYDAEPLPAEFQIDVLGLVDFSSNDTFIASAQGTYKITFFGTSPGKSDNFFLGSQTDVPVTTDCELYKTLFKTDKCQGGGIVKNILVDPSNFVGKATITINSDGSAVIHTKILMTAGTMASQSPNDQYQYSVYRTTSGGDSSNSGGTVKGITGRHLTANGTWDSSTFDVRQYKNNLSKEIILYSNLIGKDLGTLGVVNPKTYVIMTKESSQPEKMDYSDISKAPFNSVTGINPTDLGEDAPAY